MLRPVKPSLLLRVIALLSIALLALASACGGGDEDPSPTGTTGATGPTAATGATETAPTGPQSGEPIEGFEHVQAAVVQVIARGTFRDPEVGLSNGSGAGSGFVISRDGLVVTNNHVVAGAATIEVFIGGDTTQSYNATILGVSECNDLALIDVREPAPLPYLEWYEEEIVPGIDVYAAGFPLGDPQFTLTRGIVSKARADGDITGTSSIDHTIEHDANIQPGNSGGPLVSTDGRVVGVNYAGGAVDSTTTAPQFFAIASHLAEPVVDELKDGDFESLGINGWAVLDEEESIAGVWVAGVAAGSPASRVGLLPGDIIRAMNGLPVGTDGTMADYCDVIRTAGDRAITIEVLRYDTGEILRGEVNGDKQLTVVFSPAQDLAMNLTEDQTGGPTSYAGYVSVTDDTGTIWVDVPEEWAETQTAPLNIDGEEIPYIAAAPNLNEFFNTYSASGMEFAVFAPREDLEATVDIFAPEDGNCEADLGYEPYADAYYTGVYHAWEQCGDNGAVYLVLAAVPVDVPPADSFTAVLLVQLTVDADFEALATMFSTFNVAQ